MDCYFDRTGFPFVVLREDIALDVSLLPLTKLQFECYLADQNTPEGDEWYEELLKLNPRVSPQSFSPAQRELLFLTGVLPQEVERYAKWLGDGYRLPAKEEWQAICRSSKTITFSWPPASLQSPNTRATALLCRLQEQVRPQTLLDFNLMRDGVVEWVRFQDGWTGLGAPRPSFQKNLWQPPNDIVSPIKPNERIRFFGARLVRVTGPRHSDSIWLKFINHMIC